MSEPVDDIAALRDRIESLERENEKLSRELTDMERLDRRVLRAHGSESDVLRQVLEVIASRLPAAVTAVALADSQAKGLRIAAANGLEQEALGIPLKPNAGPVGQTLRGGSPRSFPARRFGLVGEKFQNVDSVTLVPMRLPSASVGSQEEKDVPGVVLVATTPETQLQGDDLEFLRRVGVHGAVLLENTRLFDTLQRSEETYRTMVERAHLGMALLERDGQMRHTNEPMRELLGIDTEENRPFIDHIAAEDRPAVEAHLDLGRDAPLAPTEVTLLGATGSRRVRMSVTPIRERRERITGHVVMARDITEEVALANEREAMARRVQQAERLSAVGQFVAGIAHELNNPLTVVIGYTELLEAEEAINPRLGALVEQILHHAMRCGRIVADLLTFSRQEQRHPEPVILADVVHEALSATRHKVRPTDAIEADVMSDVPPVFGSPHALCQVVINIVANALDAVSMEETPGRIYVSLERGGGEQRLTVRDNGPGFSNPERIFDPFYTTKPIGQGTGLGLSICYGIARDHGGSLVAENAEGGGAMVTLVLPESPPRDEARPVLPALETVVRAVPEDTRRYKVLVVDDEPGILELVSLALNSFCDLETAETVEHGLTLLETTEVDLVLTDLRLPAGMTGLDFYEEIAARWPDLTSRVSFMTGDTVGQGTQAFLDRVRRPCLQKPFKIGQLLTFVRAQLDSDEAP